MTDKLDALIARLEAATEGSRELDAGIFIYLGKAPKVVKRGATELDWHQTNYEWSDPGTWERARFEQPAPPDRIVAPYYTTSLDAALSLVPEGWMLKDLCELNRLSGVQWFAELHRRGEEYTNNDKDAFALNGPLALCIAALKARKS